MAIAVRDVEPRAAEILDEVERAVIGKRPRIELILMGLFADGHVLIEDFPGLAKTLIARSVAHVCSMRFSRIQFTPDLMPSDVTGSAIYDQRDAVFRFQPGPVFANLLLADEINRAPAKVQSALLQAMQEREVTIGETTFALPRPFLVLATQNPIEQEGTYPLPEAQVDRFLMKVKVSYPSFQEEIEILARTSREAVEEIRLEKVLSLSDLSEARRVALDLYVDPKIDHYIVSLVQATREGEKHGLKGQVEWGASPRASIALKNCARSLAFLRGKSFVTPDDVKDVAADVLRHRVLTSFEGEARGVTSDDIVRALLKSVTVP